MKFLPRSAAVIALALTAAACGSTTGDAADTADQTADATAAVEVVEAEPVADEQDEDVDDASESASSEVVVEETTTTTAAPPPPPEPVTASTVPETTSDDFPDILAAQATPSGDGFWRFDVTVSSTYDTPQRYADAWRVVGPDGTELGIRVLTHDHANEQPFTRSQTIEIPADVTSVTIEGRDQANGWGGGFLELDLSS